MELPLQHNRLILLDAMALLYRAHFALIRNPIVNAKGVNTSALFGFTNLLLDLIDKHKPTHLAVAYDTRAPTARHIAFPEYKAGREEIPEDVALAIPLSQRLAAGFRIPTLAIDGFEADDIIGTLATQADTAGIEAWMVTPDKDFGQLVSDRVRILKPGNRGGEMELLGPKEICARWEITRPTQVIDILALMGDSSDNIPGIPGIGEKSAAKLIAEFGSAEKLFASLDKLPEKQRAKIAPFADQVRLAKELATIRLDVPVPHAMSDLLLHEPDEPALRALFEELEFNTIGRRVFGSDFRAGRGFQPTAAATETSPVAEQTELFPASALKTIADVPHRYHLVDTPDALAQLAAELSAAPMFCVDVETDSLDPKQANLCGIALAIKPGEAYFVPTPPDPAESRRILDALRPALENPAIAKTGHNLKFDLAVLLWQGITVRGDLFDTMLAHALIDPDATHKMDALSERYLGYTPIPISKLIGEKGNATLLREVPAQQLGEYSAEDADVTLQLRAVLEPLLAEKKQGRVFFEIEAPLLPALVAMEHAGIAIDREALAIFSTQLGSDIARLETSILELAGTPFNVNSPKQLGEILFDKLGLGEKPKRTKTGQYVTNEQVLQTLAPKHEIVRAILEFREANKLKSTYVDALPLAVSARTGRVHTTFSQAVTATGRLASQDPNLQNIPIRSEQGKEIRKAFVPGSPEFLILSADYSQIELRIMAALSGDPAMIGAFTQDEDIHRATAARVYGTDLGSVTDAMRRTAKMVNFGIIYGISSFGLAQRLGIPKTEAGAIIDNYFAQYPGVKAYMDHTIAFAREHGFVETKTGRRRYLRDIRSANATARQAAERTAINAPIQGTAADMIKIAMGHIHRMLENGRFQTRMLLQVHDELVFELHRDEETALVPQIRELMESALPLGLPIVVETGVGDNWLDAH